MLGNYDAIKSKECLETQLDALLQNAVNSYAIEGESLNVTSVKSSIARKIGVAIDRVAKIKPQDDGVSELLFDATRNTEAELSTVRIFQWHNNLFAGRKSILYEVNAGKFREDEMEVVSGAIGKCKVHYVAPPPELLDSEMSKFVAWFNNSRNSFDLIQTSLHQIKKCLPTPCLK